MIPEIADTTAVPPVPRYAAKDCGRNQIELLGVRFDNLTTCEAADRIEQFISDRVPRLIFARNAGIRVLEDDNPSIYSLYERSNLVTVDGMAFVYLGRLAGRPFKEMTGGPALWYEVLRRAAIKGYRVFLLGATEETVGAAVGKLREQFPDLQVVGYRNGYFDCEDAVVEAIRQTQPDVLMVGMSSPKKEEFLMRNLDRLQVPTCIGVGGALDLFAGLYDMAPLWMRKACLEWLYRVWQEPRRLAARYLVSNTRFVLLVLRYVVRRQ